MRANPCLLAGYLISAGTLSLGQSLAVVDSGALIGASGLFWLARRGGRPLLLRHGRVLRIDERRLEQLMRFFQRLGPCGPGICRLIPGLRIYSSALACLALVSYRRFLWNVTWACTVWGLFFLLQGRVIGRHWHDCSRASSQGTIYLLAALALLGIAYVCLRRRRIRWIARCRGASRRRTARQTGFKAVNVLGDVCDRGLGLRFVCISAQDDEHIRMLGGQD